MSNDEHKTILAVDSPDSDPDEDGESTLSAFLQPEADLLPHRFRLAAWLRLASATALLMATVVFFFGAYRDSVLTTIWPRLASWLDLATPDEIPDLRPGAMEGVTIMVDCTPHGTTIMLNKVRRGTCPAIISHECRSGNAISLVLRKKGYRTWRKTWRCGSGPLFKVHQRLVRERP